MFEKLTRLRAELERITPRYEEITAKYEDIKAKIREEEVTQIIGVVDKVNMTPEQLAEYLGVREEKKPAPSKNKKSAQDKKTAETKTADEYAESSAGSDDQNTTNVGMEDILNESY